MSAAKKVLDLIQEHDVEFVDLRFADMLGKHHHVTFPSHTIDESTFEDGKMFDGSSISGWKGINESDMVDRKSTRLNSSHVLRSRMPSSA